MKVLIWFLCLLPVLIIQTEMRLGAIPTVLLTGGALWLATTLCKAWDKRKSSKKEKQQ